MRDGLQCGAILVKYSSPWFVLWRRGMWTHLGGRDTSSFSIFWVPGQVEVRAVVRSSEEICRGLRWVSR